MQSDLQTTLNTAGDAAMEFQEGPGLLFISLLYVLTGGKDRRLLRVTHIRGVGGIKERNWLKVSASNASTRGNVRIANFSSRGATSPMGETDVMAVFVKTVASARQSGTRLSR